MRIENRINILQSIYKIFFDPTHIFYYPNFLKDNIEKQSKLLTLNDLPKVSSENIESMKQKALRISIEQFMDELRCKVKLFGYKNLAEKSGLGRESLYKSLKPGSKIRFETVIIIAQALDIEVSFNVI